MLKTRHFSALKCSLYPDSTVKRSVVSGVGLRLSFALTCTTNTNGNSRPDRDCRGRSRIVALLGVLVLVRAVVMVDGGG